MAKFNGKDIVGILTKAVPTKLETKTVTPTTEQQVILPSEGYHALSSVTIEGVDSNITLQSKTVTENGEVTPDEGYDGLSSVTVAISTYDGTITVE